MIILEKKISPKKRIYNVGEEFVITLTINNGTERKFYYVIDFFLPIGEPDSFVVVELDKGAFAGTKLYPGEEVRVGGKSVVNIRVKANKTGTFDFAPQLYLAYKPDDESSQLCLADEPPILAGMLKIEVKNPRFLQKSTVEEVESNSIKVC